MSHCIRSLLFTSVGVVRTIKSSQLFPECTTIQWSQHMLSPLNSTRITSYSPQTLFWHNTMTINLCHNMLKADFDCTLDVHVSPNFSFLGDSLFAVFIENVISSFLVCHRIKFDLTSVDSSEVSLWTTAEETL